LIGCHAIKQARPVPYTIIFTERYTRIAARFLKHHPDMARAYEKTLALLQVNPQHPSLRMHQLGGRLQGVHSVSINLSYRITLHLLVTEREIVPLNVGEHDAVY
jgi:mRNA-degrading endonuclease YafQ of YafQ-DinJ toxin-antitoxin module